MENRPAPAASNRDPEIFVPGEELGRGAYGRVFKAQYNGSVCAAKEVHSILIAATSHSPEERIRLQQNFERECDCCSKLTHPNIVHFIGIYHPPQQLFPVMIMELMDESLTAYAEKQDISFTQRMFILHDVAEGLSYLHSRNPPVIHRDLSPNNILLKHLPLPGPLLPVAKLADLGVAKILNFDDRNSKKYQTKVPGTMDFMPPEALQDKPEYGTPLDVFSYGGIMLHTVNGKWPTPAALTKFDPLTRQVRGFSEVERRQEHLDKMTGEAEVLRPLVEACLDNDPVKRPSIAELSEKIKPLKSLTKKDADVINPLEDPEELPKAEEILAVNGVEFIHLVKNVGDSISKMTSKMPKMSDECDEWFEEKAHQYSMMEGHLKKLYKAIETIAGHRKKLASSSTILANGIVMLANVERNATISKALLRLSEVEGKIHELHDKQVNKDTFVLGEIVRDHINLISAIKNAFDIRLKAFNTWTNSHKKLTKKREQETKLKAGGKPHKLQAVQQEVKEWEEKVEEDQKEFERISKGIKEEVNQYELKKATEYKNKMVTYLEAIMQLQEELVEQWEAYLPEAKAITA